MSSELIEKSTLVVCRARLTFTDKFLPDPSAFVSRTRPIGLFRGDFSLNPPPFPLLSFIYSNKVVRMKLRLAG